MGARKGQSQRERSQAAALRRLEQGEIQTMIGLRLSQEEAIAVHTYAQHMGITPVLATRELMKIGLASDPMSAMLTAARFTAYEEVRRYAADRFSAAMKEISDDIGGFVRGDPNTPPPRGMR